MANFSGMVLLGLRFGGICQGGLDIHAYHDAGYLATQGESLAQLHCEIAFRRIVPAYRRRRSRDQLETALDGFVFRAKGHTGLRNRNAIAWVASKGMANQ